MALNLDPQKIIPFVLIGSLMLFAKPIPKGSVIHHTCSNRSCINPDHLQSHLTKTHEMVERRTYRKEIRELKKEIKELRNTIESLNREKVK